MAYAQNQRPPRGSGRYELERSYEGGRDLHQLKEECPKNPKHEKFISLSKFNKDHLEEQYRHPRVVQTIQALASLTVCIILFEISGKRPDNIPDTNYEYPFTKYRGQQCFVTGTGWITRVKTKYSEADNRPCPCRHCKKKPVEERCKQWGRVELWTAAHVIFDKKEAGRADLILFLDEEDDLQNPLKENKSVRDKLIPYRVKAKDVVGDWCWVRCVTHDLVLWEKLRLMAENYEALQRETDEIFKYMDNSKLAVVISHPHGCCKTVSIGEWTDRDDIEHKGDNINTRYYYSAATCPGSSGSPVWILGLKRRGVFTSHPHSIHYFETLNESGYGINY